MGHSFKKRHKKDTKKTRNKTSQTTTPDVPLDCVVRIMAFAGMLGKLESLCREYRTIHLGKRMLYSEMFKWNFVVRDGAMLPRKPRGSAADSPVVTHRNYARRE